ncbi:uncharacterized protein F4822DRAFT_416422 [Hypoxylon trugodes]|uniref:uncharacterized protein n=1 Tax=Hypoxylon trugodes TaxID=326681 RepID=UPI002193D5E2|nr:uncharacterized protein F4822DRAFT_416422 [Hypoxylon trugodes]KAI1384845.1 hypothetical protein F4822DRAFT_416422 [Hypoxylon trugodes]
MATWYLPEIVRIISEYAEKPDFAALCRTSRGLHYIGNEMLYESITLNLREKGPKWFHLLCRALLGSTGFDMYVRRLHIVLCYDTRHGYAKPSSEEVSSQLQTLSSIIRKCINLRAINVTRESTASHSAIQAFDQSLIHSSQLREITVQVQYTGLGFYPSTGEVDVNTSLLLDLLQSSSTTSLNLLLEQGPESLLQIPSYPTNNNVVKLSLIRSGLHMTSLQKILTAVPNLQDLSLSFMFDADRTMHHIGCFLDGEKLGRVLATVSSRLRSLRLVARFCAHTAYDVSRGTGEPNSWGLIHNWFGSLNSFKKLKSLEMDPTLLLGWDRSKADWNKLSDVLPESLESLYFRDDFEAWDYSPWNDELWTLHKLLIDYLDEPQSKMLKKLRLTAPNGLTETLNSMCNDRKIHFSCDEFWPPSR